MAPLAPCQAAQFSGCFQSVNCLETHRAGIFIPSHRGENTLMERGLAWPKVAQLVDGTARGGEPRWAGPKCPILLYFQKYNTACTNASRLIKNTIQKTNKQENPILLPPRDFDLWWERTGTLDQKNKTESKDCTPSHLYVCGRAS